MASSINSSVDIVADPDAHLSALPLLTEGERHQLLVEFNDTAVQYPKDKCIHQLFEEQVELNPNATAVVFEDQSLTYGELNARSNQLAHHLQSLGVGPEVLVGICIERSLEMIVGLLGILKAGGAYVPLDPGYPKDRIAFMLQDAAPIVLLTQEKALATLPEHGAQVLCLDRDWKQITQEIESSPASDVGPQNLVYVIYTSGSTGRPKGVMIEHFGASNLAFAQSEAYNLQPSDNVLQFASLSFDASVFEWILALTHGATLCLGTVTNLSPGLSLVKLLKEQAITIALFMPSILKMLPMQDLPDLHTVIVGGEECARDLFVRWASYHRIYNAYGPTEATVVAAQWQWHCCPKNGFVTIPIGRPIANTQAYVLDKRMELVLLGVAGELYIAGAGVARGYLNRPELTSEKFIPNPFGAGRLYKTGDLVRWRADGNLEFLGRLDDQVKIRGFRIELGEVEAALREHPSVKEAVVVAREDVAGDKRLVAYIVLEGEAGSSPADLRLFLKERLPQYMMPSAFVTLDTIPLSSNGKTDRRALPIPNQLADDTTYVPARTLLEEQLTDIWAKALGLQTVGIHNDFLDLGGHSLLATQLVSQIRQTLGMELPIVELFNNSTVAKLSNYFQQLPPQDYVRRNIYPVSRAADLPVSFSQQQLWFLYQLEPHNLFYNIPIALRLSGSINFIALKQSLNEIVHRHEALRTTFSSWEGQPVQVIAPSVSVPLVFTDLSHLPMLEQAVAANQVLAEATQQPFNLVSGPLMRANLLSMDEQHILIVDMHHVVGDDWSYQVLFRELGLLYNAFSQGLPSPLPELPIQYADYTVWQRERLQGAFLQEQLGYWKEKLAGVPELLELPTDYPRPAVQSYKGFREYWSLNPKVVEDLRRLALSEGVTLFMVLLAAFQVLLMRHTGQEDIVVGSPIAGRTQEETEDLIGFFVNTLPLRTDLSGDPSFREMLGRVRETCLGAYAHQELPFEKIVEELAPERNLSYNPLVQVLLAFQSSVVVPSKLGPLDVQSLKLGTSTTRFDLEFQIVDDLKGLSAWIDYSTDLFEAATIVRLLGHYQVLLAGIVADPDARLSALPLLTAAESHQLVVEFNDTAAEYPQDKCVHQLFEEQVERSPDAVAVVFEDSQLTYGELNARSNQLAHHLQSLGVGPEVLVGLCVERSIEMIVGLLAILKAGGAYVPLDPGYPRERLAFMLQDVAPIVLLTQEKLIGSLPEYGGQVLCLDSDWHTIRQEPESNLVSEVCPQNLVYVIYTSGSTGNPKGAMLEHEGLRNLITWQQLHSPPQPGDRTLQFASLSFDVSFQELFLTLTSGGVLMLILEDLRQDPFRLLRFIQNECITHLLLPFVALHQLAESMDGIDPNSAGSIDLKEAEPIRLREVITAGEQLQITPKIVRFFRGLSGCTLSNQYGPSETHVVTHFTLPGSSASWPELPPIGRPIANTQAYVLDKRMELVPIGVAGELYIGGVQVGRGYLNRPDLTAQKFIPNPFGAGRLYKTGDLVRWRSDGNLEFLGRLDDQVKVRGFRIELGEVQAALLQHPAVKEAVVVAREDAPGDKRLVAYIVAEGEASPSSADLRQFLKAALPEYMVPSAFVVLEALPLTPSGKLNRRGLPAPDQNALAREAEYVAPRTPVEEVLCGIWMEVLGLERVGIHDNFFELGGHSLLATKVVSRLRDVSMPVPLQVLFVGPTIAQLALQCRLPLQDDNVSLQRIGKIHRQNPETHISNVSALSEAELDALLAELLNESEAENEDKF